MQIPDNFIKGNFHLCHWQNVSRSHFIWTPWTCFANCQILKNNFKEKELFVHSKAPATWQEGLSGHPKLQAYKWNCYNNVQNLGVIENSILSHRLRSSTPASFSSTYTIIQCCRRTIYLNFKIFSFCRINYNSVDRSPIFYKFELFRKKKKNRVYWHDKLDKTAKLG